MAPVRRTLYICDGVACGLSQCRELADRLAKVLGIGMNERTIDGMIAIRSMRCREQPAASPLIMIEDDCIEIERWEDLDPILTKVLTPAEDYA